MAARERVGSSLGKSPCKKLAFSLGQQPAYNLCMLASTCLTPPHPFPMISFHLLQTLLCDAKISIHFFILFIFLPQVFSGHRKMLPIAFCAGCGGVMFLLDWDQAPKNQWDSIWCFVAFCSGSSWWKYTYSSEVGKSIGRLLNHHEKHKSCWPWCFVSWQKLPFFLLLT